MKMHNIYKKILICLALVCLCPSMLFGATSCPFGSALMESDSIIVTADDSTLDNYLAKGYTVLNSDMELENCTSISSSTPMCTFYTDVCQVGKYFDGSSHKECLTGNYCDGTGTAIPGTPGCSMVCPENSTSAAGASDISQCVGGHTLHIGDDITMNLTTIRPETPRVMVFQVLNELYYGGLSDTEKTINKNTDKKFHIFFDNKDYWLHDYTVE